jgi:hypothetical protein
MVSAVQQAPMMTFTRASTTPSLPCKWVFSGDATHFPVWDSIKELWRSQVEVPDFSDVGAAVDALMQTKAYGPQWHAIKLGLAGQDACVKEEFVNTALDRLSVAQNSTLDQLADLVDAETDQEETWKAELPDYVRLNKGLATARKTESFVKSCFQQVLDTALKATCLIDVGSVPQTIWEHENMLNIYMKFILMAYGTVSLLSYVVPNPLQLVALSSALFLSVSAAIDLYLKNRPIPSKLPWAVNLSKNLPEKSRSYVRQDLIDRILPQLVAGNKAIILIGEPGVGKTELLETLAQKVRKKTFFLFNSLEITAVDQFNPPATKINFLLQAIEGWHEKVVLCFDEFGKGIKKNSAMLDMLLMPLAKKEGRPKIIATMTKKEFEEMIAGNEEYEDRFELIEVPATTAEETKEILQLQAEMEGYSSILEQGTVERIVASETGQKHKNQPRVALNKLNGAIAKRQTFDPSRCEGAEKARKAKALVDRLVHISNEHHRWVKLENCNPAKKTRQVFAHTMLRPWIERKVRQLKSELPDDIPLTLSPSMFPEPRSDKLISIVSTRHL